MEHTEAIIELKNAVNKTLIKKLIALIDKKSKDKLQINAGGVDQNVRNVNGYHLNFTTPTNLFYWNVIKKEVERVYALYKAKFPKMKSIKINQIDLLKYSPGGKYEVHTDHFTISPRHLSIIINLNNTYEGGDLIFTDQHEKEIKRYKLSEGSVVFFPSNFMYPHSIEPITKGTRYSIVAWLQ
jgi:Rps23 Pro-64 3,4-dihydroxylase Tpa1-like proline 4-hydroxylase|tara:strand:+ start:2761 stop:3309 length:549 start_codon:yes stop_codon:yes gene_type:complete